MYYIRVREGKNENLKKEGKMRISILISIYTVHFAILKMYTKFENTGPPLVYTARKRGAFKTILSRDIRLSA